MNGTKHTTQRGAAGLAAALILTLATTALAGPPWLSIELPANPYDELTRGAIALVRTYHHGVPMQIQARGMAEGLVDGERVSLPVDLVATSATGVYALRGEIPETGSFGIPMRDELQLELRRGEWDDLIERYSWPIA